MVAQIQKPAPYVPPYLLKSSWKRDARMKKKEPLTISAFSGTAVKEGSFEEIKLSDYLGKWVILVFYPMVRLIPAYSNWIGAD